MSTHTQKVLHALPGVPEYDLKKKKILRQQIKDLHPVSKLLH